MGCGHSNDRIRRSQVAATTNDEPSPAPAPEPEEEHHLELMSPMAQPVLYSNSAPNDLKIGVLKRLSTTIDLSQEIDVVKALCKLPEDIERPWTTFSLMLTLSLSRTLEEIMSNAHRMSGDAMLVLVHSSVIGLDFCLGPVFTAVTEFISNVSADESWDADSQMKPLLRTIREAHQGVSSSFLAEIEAKPSLYATVKTAEHASAEGWATSDDEAANELAAAAMIEGVIARLILVLRGVRKVNMIRKIIASNSFRFPALNRSLRVLLAAAWRPAGDAVSGSAPPWLAVNYLSSVLFPRTGPSSTAGSRPSTAAESDDEGDPANKKRARASDKLLYEWCANNGGLLLLLDGPSKQFIVHNILRRGLPRQQVTTCRTACLSDTMAALSAAGHLLPGKLLKESPAAVPDKEGFCAILHPYFKSTFGSGLSGNSAGIEEGEGHGPRKEIFIGLSQELAREYEEDRLGQGHLHGMMGDSILRCAGGTSLMQQLQRGDRLTLFKLPRSESSQGLDLASPTAAEVEKEASPFQFGGALPTVSERSDDKEVMRGVVSSVIDDNTVQLEADLAFDVALSRFRIASLAAVAPVLLYRKGAESHWLNPELKVSTASLERSAFLGWLCASAISNRAQFGLDIARPFFAQLLADTVSPAEPEMADALPKQGPGSPRRGLISQASVANLAAVSLNLPPLKTAQDAARFELDAAAACTFTPTWPDLAQLDYELLATAENINRMPQATFATLLEAEDLPLSTSKQEYLVGMLNRLVLEDVAPQMLAVRKGFMHAIGAPSLKLLRAVQLDADDLREIVCGPSMQDPDADFDVQQYYRVVAEEDVRAYPVLLSALWKTIGSWKPLKKRKFLMFFSGVDKLPTPFSEDLVIELPFVAYGPEDQKKMLQTLPQSHTCSNTLELPNYQEALTVLNKAKPLSDEKLEEMIAAILEDKLSLAIDNAQGYGLDNIASNVARAAAAGGAGGASKDPSKGTASPAPGGDNHGNKIRPLGNSGVQPVLHASARDVPVSQPLLIGNSGARNNSMLTTPLRASVFPGNGTFSGAGNLGIGSVSVRGAMSLSPADIGVFGHKRRNSLGLASTSSPSPASFGLPMPSASSSSSSSSSSAAAAHSGSLLSKFSPSAHIPEEKDEYFSPSALFSAGGAQASAAAANAKARGANAAAIAGLGGGLPRGAGLASYDSGAKRSGAISARNDPTMSGSLRSRRLSRDEPDTSAVSPFMPSFVSTPTYSRAPPTRRGGNVAASPMPLSAGSVLGSDGPKERRGKGDRHGGGRNYGQEFDEEERMETLIGSMMDFTQLDD